MANVSDGLGEVEEEVLNICKMLILKTQVPFVLLVRKRLVDLQALELLICHLLAVSS